MNKFTWSLGQGYLYPPCSLHYALLATAVYKQLPRHGIRVWLYAQPNKDFEAKNTKKLDLFKVMTGFDGYDGLYCNKL